MRTTVTLDNDVVYQAALTLSKHSQFSFAAGAAGFSSSLALKRFNYDFS
jgi:hypothetical protein